MKTNEADQHSWNHEDMQREKSRQRRSGNNRATEHQFHDYWARKGYATGDRSSDTQAPVSILIKTQHLAAESHAERHEQKRDAYDPAELPWKLVRSEAEDLH